MATKRAATITATQALQEWQKAHPDQRIEEVEEMNLQFQHPPIKLMTDRLAQLANCKKLSVSTNNIEEINFLPPRIEILSIGRNLLKRLDKIDRAAATLQQLWMSYNDVKSFAPLVACKRLRVLYAAWNKIDKVSELDRLAQLPLLEDLVLIGNPIVDEINKRKSYRTEVFKKLKKLTVLDGVQITDADRGEDVNKQTGDVTALKTTGNQTSGVSGAESVQGSRSVSPRPDTANSKA